MCDTYERPCEGCGVFIALHIGDFCTPRKNVKVWCGKCLRELLTHSRRDIEDVIGNNKVFLDLGRRQKDADGECVVNTESPRGAICMILCSDHKATLLHLN